MDGKLLSRYVVTVWGILLDSDGNVFELRITDSDAKDRKNTGVCSGTELFS